MYKLLIITIMLMVAVSHQANSGMSVTCSGEGLAVSEQCNLDIWNKQMFQCIISELNNLFTKLIVLTDKDIITKEYVFTTQAMQECSNLVSKQACTAEDLTKINSFIDRCMASGANINYGGVAEQDIKFNLGSKR